MNLRQALKILHTLGSAGYIGALLAYAVILVRAPQATPQAVADMRGLIDAVCSWVLLPSAGVVLLTGLLSMAFHKPFLEMRWAWVKAALGLSVFEGTMIVIQGRARLAAGVADSIAKGEAEPDALARLVGTEWWAWGIMLAIAVINVVLGVWRPRLAWGTKS